MTLNSTNTPLATAKAFLAGIKARDIAGMRQMCFPDATACRIRNGVPVYSTIADILDRIEHRDVSMDEISYNEIEHIDGIFATVWTAYEFWENGKLHHTGSNNFCMWRNPEERWVITAIQDIAYHGEGVKVEAMPFSSGRDSQ